MKNPKVSEMGKAFGGIASKEIIAVMAQYGVTLKSHAAVMSNRDLDILLTHYTNLHTAESPDKIFASAEQKDNTAANEAAAEAKAKEAPKANEKAPKADKKLSENDEKISENGTKASSRYVDTRPRTVDMDRINSENKMEKLVGDDDKLLEQSGGKKQKIKKNRNKSSSNKMVKNEVKKKEAPREHQTVEIPDQISVGDLAEKIGVPGVELVKKLFILGIMASLSQVIDFDTAALIAEEFDTTLEHEVIVTDEDLLFNDTEDAEEDLQPRSPVVVVMGHVDHGKTSLLDAVRNTNVIATEAGGITQHIGASVVEINGQKITFLDTPGHAAFTAMRARGAQVTDVAILVVAADDGIMPQTVEAINHAKEAGVTIIVAINKIDKEGADPGRVKQALTEYGLVPEEWGGDTICVEVSAKKNINIDGLLEMVLLVAEMKELKANPNRRAKGTVIESRLDKGRGPVATVLVQNGTLRVGDVVVAGTAVGKVRAMINSRGERVKEAGPSVPVEITGLSETPQGGDIFHAVDDERKARSVVEARKQKIKDEIVQAQQKVSLDNLFDCIKEGEMKELDIIVKADVAGSVEAVKQSLEKLSNDEVRVRTIHGGVGGINETDVMLANASNAIIVGFNVRPEASAVETAHMEGVDIRLYRVIYEAIDEIEAAMRGMLDPKFKEVILGHAEIRQTFKVSGVGTIAGAYVLDGHISRNCDVRVNRDNIVIHEGHLSSLKRFKDDVKEVQSGYECGMGLENFNDIKEGDIIECYTMEEIAR